MEEAAKERFADIECHLSVTCVLDYTVERTNLTWINTPIDHRERTEDWRYLSLCIDYAAGWTTEG